MGGQNYDPEQGNVPLTRYMINARQVPYNGSHARALLDAPLSLVYSVLDHNPNKTQPRPPELANYTGKPTARVLEPGNESIRVVTLLNEKTDEFADRLANVWLYAKQHGYGVSYCILDELSNKLSSL